MFKHYLTAITLAVLSSWGFAQCEPTSTVTLECPDSYNDELQVVVSDGVESTTYGNFQGVFGGGVFWTASLVGGDYTIAISDVGTWQDGTSGAPLYLAVDGVNVDTIPELPGGSGEVIFSLSLDPAPSDVVGCSDETASNYTPCVTIEAECEYFNTVTIVLTDEYGSTISPSCDGWYSSFYGFGGLVFNGDSIPYFGSDCDNNNFEIEIAAEDGCYAAQIVLPAFGTEASWAAYAPDGSLINSGEGSESAFTETFLFYIGSSDQDCVVIGCTDATACNFNPEATFPGECDVVSCAGCTDSGACNYDETATLDNGSCDYSCVGCLDDTALNYDPTSTIACSDCCIQCPDAALVLTLFDSYGDGWNTNSLTINGVDYSMPDADGDYTTTSNFTVYCPQASGCGESFNLCLDTTQCIEIVYNDIGPYNSENAWQITDLDGNIITEADFTSYSDGPDFGLNGSLACSFGCNDSSACNYDATADLDDGSCDYSCIGCTLATAANYDPSATLPCVDADEDGTPDCCVTCDPGTFFLSFNAYDSFGDGWTSSYSLYAYDGDGQPLLTGTVDADSSEAFVCVEPGCYYVQTTSDQDPNEVSLVITDAFGTVYPTIGAGQVYDLDFATNACGFLGCTDESALNYDPSASELDPDNPCLYPPSNDMVDDAAALACGLSLSGSLALAQDIEGLAGTAFGQSILAGGSVWYEINSDANQAITISTCDTPENDQSTSYATDTELAIFDAGLTLLGTNSVGCDGGAHASIEFYAEAGASYLIRVTGLGGDDFVISASCDADAPAPPSNDNCENAIVVPNDQAVAIDLCGSQTEGVWLPWSGDDTGYNGATAYSQWFAFNAADYDGFYFAGTNLSDDDDSSIGVALMSGNDCGEISPYLGNVVGYQVAGSTTTFGLQLVENANYYFVFWTEDPSACGMAELLVQGIYQGCTDPAASNFDPIANEEDFSCLFDGAPDNDACEGAIALSCDSVYAGSTGGSTSAGAPNGACETFPGAGVWYSFMGDGSLVSLDLCGSPTDTRMSVLSADAACGGAYVDAPPADACDSLVTLNWAFDDAGLYASEASFTISQVIPAQDTLSQDSTVVYATGAPNGGYFWETSAGSVCLAPGDYTLTVTDQYGDTWDGGTLTLSNGLGEVLGMYTSQDLNGTFSSTEFESQSYTINVAPYSTDPIVYPGVFECVELSVDGGALCDAFDGDDASVQFVSNDSSFYYVYVQTEDLDNNPFTDESGAFSLTFNCETPVYGCQDPAACNYVAESNVATDCDYFSCLCPDSTGVALEFSMESAYWFEGNQVGIGWQESTYSIISAADSSVVASGSLDAAATAVDADNYIGNDSGADYFCLAPGCYDIVVTAGLIPDGIGWALSTADGTSLASGSPAAFSWSTGTGVGVFSVSIGGAVCGCTDMGACNFNPLADSEDGSCDYLECAGCMDTSACNFDMSATISDPAQCCYDNCLTVTKDDYFYNDGWAGSYYEIQTIDGVVVGTGTLGSGAGGEVDSYCVEDGCYVLKWFNSGTFDDNEISIEIGGAFGQIVTMGCFSFGSDCPNEDYADITFNVGSGTECTYGCQVAQACNYNPDANYGGLDACVFDGCAGCTYPNADNYAAQGIDDNGNEIPGWEEALVLDDGSCTFTTANPCPADLNGDGSVSTADLLEFLTAFGSSC